ncbi:AAA family ATPase [Ornithinimicrobium sp. W1679]|uniref:AAA family ATPase n=1 Tax=Ornithinimicrobium sp. W1679 TaxID=3418770 RepID=UPI003CE7AF15
MNTVILVSESTDLIRRARLATDDQLLVLTRHQLPTGPAQLLALAGDPDAVRAVVVDADGDEELERRTLALAGRLDQAYPSVSLLMVSSRGAELGLEALRAGVRDILEPETAVEDIRWALRRADESAATRVSGRRAQETFSGRVITVASPKGGVGKTTISTNIAVALTRQSPQGTVLVDLDVQFGDVAAALDLDPTYTLTDVLGGPAAADPIALKALLTQHPSGLNVVPGVKSPAEADHIRVEQIARLIDLLKREFRFVVIDTAPGLTEQTLAAMDHTTDLVLVTSLDVPGVRGLRKELEVLEELDVSHLTTHVVVNMADRSAGLRPDDVEATLGRRIDLLLPRAPKMALATNRGEPLVASSPRDRLSRDLLALVDRFAPGTSHTRGRGRRRASA